MELNISTSIAHSRLDFNRISFSQSATSQGADSPPARGDRVELSTEATTRGEETSLKHLRQTHREQSTEVQAAFLKEVLQQLTGAKITDLNDLPGTDSPQPSSIPAQEQSFALEQENLSLESSSLFIGGTINTSDGKKLSFSLDLQILKASAVSNQLNFNTNADGYEFSFNGSSSELTSSSFSFSLNYESAEGIAGGRGLGAFALKDDLKEISRAVKPMVKDYLHDAGMPYAQREVKQLIRSVA